MSLEQKKKVIIIGAGPAGLTAGVELLKTQRCDVVLLERDAHVGGLARTTDYKGYKFDLGPHHFITHLAFIEKWWKDLMGKDFVEHKRFTRIFYKKKYFNYPLDALNVIRSLSIRECVRCVGSYTWRQIFPIKPVRSFQDWITNKFGYRLFSIFFKTYTEKVWGITCDKISSDWAAQRIKGFSLSKAIFFAFFGRWFKKNAPRTIADTFYYPVHGSGQLWDKVAATINHKGGTIVLNEAVVAVHHKEGKIRALHTVNEIYIADYFLSSMPLKALINAMQPAAPADVVAAAAALEYRGLITVNLIVDKKNTMPDHWLYVHDKDVYLGRVGNMNNFSPFMVANQNHTSLALEYFSYTDSFLWKQSDGELIELGKKELEKLGLAASADIIDGMVQRAAEAYPVYDEHYKENLALVRDYLALFSNLQLMGRNGLHRYNNMDLAMASAFDAIKPIQEELALGFPAHQVMGEHNREQRFLT